MAIRDNIIGLAFLAVAAPLHAQMFQDFAPGMVMGNLHNELLERRLDENIDDTIAMPLAELTEEQALDFTFTPDVARTANNLDRFVQMTAKSSSAGARDLETLIAAQPDLVQTIGSAVRSFGIDPNNVSDVYALWWMSAWQAANSRNDTPDAATISAVKAQARSAFAATPGFTQTSDADRQQYAEAMLIQTALMDAAMDEAKGKPEELAKLARAAREGAKASGLDLSAMTLTNKGFVPRKGADTSLIFDEGNPALAHNQMQIDDDMSLSTYLAIAAAASVGLGGAYLLGKKSMRG